MTIIRDHHPPVFLHEVGEVITGPIVVDFRKMLRRITGDGLAPVLAADLITPGQDELSNESESDGHRSGPDDAEFVESLAEVFAPVTERVGVVDDQEATANGHPVVLQRIHFLFNQGVVLINLLEPLVGWSWPSVSNATKKDIIDDGLARNVEHGVVGLPDEDWTHGIIAGIANGQPVFMGPLVRHEVGDFLNGHLANEKIFFMTKHRLESPSSFLLRVSVDQVVLLETGGYGLPEFSRSQKVLLKIQHLSKIALVDPDVIALLPCRDIPSAMLRINPVQVVGNETMFLQSADAGQISMILKRFEIIRKGSSITKSKGA